jgi:hypothetical protein
MVRERWQALLEFLLIIPPDYNLVPEPLKQWMDVHIPYAHILTKEHWINIAISIISKTLADRAGLDYYFGLPDTTSPVRAAADLAANLHSKSPLRVST